jgi:hypothetical protein
MYRAEARVRPSALAVSRDERRTIFSQWWKLQTHKLCHSQHLRTQFHQKLTLTLGVSART